MTEPTDHVRYRPVEFRIRLIVEASLPDEPDAPTKLIGLSLIPHESEPGDHFQLVGTDRTGDLDEPALARLIPFVERWLHLLHERPVYDIRIGPPTVRDEGEALITAMSKLPTGRVN